MMSLYLMEQTYTEEVWGLISKDSDTKAGLMD